MAWTPATAACSFKEKIKTPQVVGFSGHELVTHFQKSLDLIRDRVEQVARGHLTGVLIVGRPGTLKTVTAIQTLSELAVFWKTANSRVTPMGLFRQLSEAPESVHLLDDVGELLSAGNRLAIQVLLAALGGEPGTPRRVTYISNTEQSSFNFSGGVILVGNEMPSRAPLLDALRSRVSVLQHDPSDEEMIAFMRVNTTRGYKQLAPAECNETLNFLIDETRSAGIRLDLRHVRNAYEDRLYASEHGRRSWQDLVRSALQKPTLHARSVPISQQSQLAAERGVASELLRQFPGRSNKTQRDHEWQKLTGKSPASLHRRLLEVKAANRRPR